VNRPASPRDSRATPLDSRAHAAIGETNRPGVLFMPIRSGVRWLWQRITPAATKVPEITLLFWVIKLLTTAMGEATSDFLVFQIDPVIAVILGAIGLATAMALQLLARRYVPALYWLAVAMVAVFGTMGADVVHIGLGVPYVVSSVFFALCLAVIFAVWYATEGTLSIHSIYTPRRELFYWATVMATFALGTAAGDMTASTMGLGYFNSGVMFGALFALPALGYRFLRVNPILAFWIAYVLTRPFGASFADWAGKSPSLSGLGLGTGAVSIVLTIVIAMLVGYLTVTQKRSSDRLATAAPAGH
jgi:uncharacterized membrane-anchored protein